MQWLQRLDFVCRGLICLDYLGCWPVSGQDLRLVRGAVVARQPISTKLSSELRALLWGYKNPVAPRSDSGSWI